MNTKFYICRTCGNIIEKINDSGVPVVCCGKKMEELIPNTVEASNEKHLPAVTVGDGVISGCVNLSGLLHMRVTKCFGE